MNKIFLNLTIFLCLSLAVTAQDKVGINTNAPGSTFSVNGNAAIGINYATQAAPANGAIIEGNVGIGTSSPNGRLEVVSTVSGTVTLDQINSVSGGISLNTNNTEYQVFTAGITGILTSVEIPFAGAGGTYTMTIHDNQTGLDIGSVTNNKAVGWVSNSFTGIHVIAGNQYGIVVANSEYWKCWLGDTYPNGGSSAYGGTADCYFKTFVQSEVNVSGLLVKANAEVSAYSLAGVGSRMVVADANGVLSTQAISGGGSDLNGAYNFGGAGAGRTITANSGAVLVDGNDGFQNTGTFGSGASLALSGAGTKMFFYPQKAAFRAGIVDGTQWDDANIGINSTSIGTNTTANSEGTTSIGYVASATGVFATAIGVYAMASGDGSTALGSLTTANGSVSTAMGCGTKAGSLGETALGAYNTDATTPDATDWVATDRLFTIGNGVDASQKSDALVMLKNGNTTLKGALTLTNGTSSFTLPQIDGTANQVLATDGSGVVSWVSPSGGGSTLNGAYNFGGAGAGRTITANSGAVLIDGNDGFQNTGTFGSGASLALSGAGTKMFFYPQKAAFRAGYVDASQWNDGNIGNYSTAMGYNTIASSDYSTAMGLSTTASSDNSTAMGNNTTASGNTSTAMGSGTTAIGSFSTTMGAGTSASGIAATAMGNNTTASGNYSTTMGNNTTASGNMATAMGQYTTASSTFSTSMGISTTASGSASTAMGNNTTGSGANSTAMGQSTTASGTSSTAVGYGANASGEISIASGKFTTAQSQLEMAIGAYNTDASNPNPSAWVATDRLFTIGNGTGFGAKSDALVMLKNGNTGFGTSTPSQKLEVVGNIKSSSLAGTGSRMVVADATGVMSTQAIPAAGSTLNNAYNFGGAGAGRTITASLGAVLVDGNDGFQNTGTWGSGATLALSGAGTKMFFYPQKAAFRAGYVDASQWNDGNIGNYSTAMGYNTIASSDYSTAMGLSTTASGDASTAMGNNTTASSDYAVAMGYNTVASGHASTAIGRNTIANSICTIAMGAYTTASGSFSTAMGQSSIADGYNSTAMGLSTTAQSYSETTIGVHNTNAVNPNASTWIATDRLFTIGNGTDPNAKSNALVILKNGNATFTGSVTAPSFPIASDKRFKKNITSIASVSGSALNNLSNIGAYYYDYRVSEFPERQFSTEKQIGFIAQELEVIYPELVKTDDKGYKSVDYAKVTPILVEAIKELNAKNEALTLKAEKAEANLNDLKAQVEKLNNATFGNSSK